MQVLDRTGVGTLWSICKVKFALAGHTHSSITDGTMTIYPMANNEVNFGGSNNSATIYFGYRAKDSKPIPTSFVFGGSTGTATLTAAKFKGALEGNATTASNASTVNGHTVNANVPSNAKFTDTNTWRGIQDNLTSTSTSESLSANQGRVLKGLVDGKANSSHTHSWSQISGAPATATRWPSWGEVTGKPDLKNWSETKSYIDSKVSSSADYNEIVTVTVTSSLLQSVGNKLNGAVITVTNHESGKTQKYTWNGTPFSFKIPSVNYYTVSAGSINSFITPSSISKYAGVKSSRNITLNYIPTGVYIYTTDNKVVDTNSWNTANNSKIVGIYVCTQDCAYIIAHTVTGDNYLAWNSYIGEYLDGVASTADKNLAMKDYAGQKNTDAIIAHTSLHGGEAARYCKNYIFKNGKNGYLWSAGEAYAAIANIDAIDEALLKVGAKSLNATYWTSTQTSDSLAWFVDFYKGIGYSTKSNSNFVVPICAL